MNGIWGGYAGPGAKTVIAAEAGAKVSFRLVPGQDPDKVILAAFRRFMQAHVPADAKLEIDRFSGSPGHRGAGRQPLRPGRAGGTGRGIRPPGGADRLRRLDPGGRRACSSLLGLDSLLMGFGLEDDQVHSPNEKFELRCFHHGMRSHARLLGHLGGS